MRLQEQELSAREVNAGKAQIEVGLEFGVGESFYLVNEELTGIDGLLRDDNESLCFQDVVESLVDHESDLGGGSRGVLIFGFGLRFGAGEQIPGAAEVGDQLADRGAGGGAREKDGIVQAAGGEAAAGVGVHSGDAEIGVGEERRAGLA